MTVPRRRILFRAIVATSLAVILLLGTAWFLFGFDAEVVKIRFNGEFRTSLPNGYAIVGSNLDTIYIVPPDHYRREASNCANGIAIAAKVDRLAVAGNHIVGVVVTSPPSELAKYEVPGYFIINSSTGFVQSGLTQAEWRNQVARLGIAPTPRLKKP